MSSRMNGTMETAKHMMASAKDGAEHALDNAKHAAGSAKASAGHTISDVLAVVLTGAKVIGGITTVVRAFGVNDALGWVRLRRRRSPLRDFAPFGAGLLVGAGVGVLLAPTSGAKLRRTIRGGLRRLLGEAKGTIERVETNVKEVAKEVVKEVEKEAVAVKDTVVETAGSAHSAALRAMPENGSTRRT